MANKVHILTLNWNGEDKLRKLAPTLFANLSGYDYTWYVKDNASKDKSIDYLKSLSNTEVLECSNNSDSFAAGVNKLLNLASPANDDYVLLLNNDLYFDSSDTLRGMIHGFEFKDVGIVGCVLLYPDTGKLQHCGVTFDKNMGGIPYHLNRGGSRPRFHYMDFQAVTGACLLTKGKFFKGLSEEFVWAFEDIDYCLRVKYELKKRVICYGENPAYHEESASLKKNPVQKMFMSSNFEKFKKKWASRIKFDADKYGKDILY